MNTKKIEINIFKGSYYFLSNYYESPLIYDGISYPTVEHAFQAAKTLDFNKRQEIAYQSTQGKAKRMGRHVQLRGDWENIKDSIMEELIIQKFTKNSYLKQQLLETGDKKLIEGNDWNDTYWGVCGGIGENHLGRILMEVRGMLK